MKTLAIELRKEKRTGVIPVLLAVGVLGAAYAFVNFIMRKDTLLNLPLAPMDVLLTQLYGMIMVLNLFGIVVAACMIYNMEFKGSAVKKMYMLPVSVPAMYLCKFQMLLITHWPQLASRAFRHFRVTKQVKDGKTFTQCIRLDERERKTELARMAGIES